MLINKVLPSKLVCGSHSSTGKHCSKNDPLETRDLFLKIIWYY